MTIVYELTSVAIKFSFLFNQCNYIDHTSIEYKLENKILNINFDEFISYIYLLVVLLK